MNKQESVDETYNLEEKLGEGSYGKVYKPVHHKTKKEAALKYIIKKYVPLLNQEHQKERYWSDHRWKLDPEENIPW